LANLLGQSHKTCFVLLLSYSELLGKRLFIRTSSIMLGIPDSKNKDILEICKKATLMNPNHFVQAIFSDLPPKDALAGFHGYKGGR